jgi:hypothetical protein
MSFNKSKQVILLLSSCLIALIFLASNLVSAENVLNSSISVSRSSYVVGDEVQLEVLILPQDNNRFNLEIYSSAKKFTYKGEFNSIMLFYPREEDIYTAALVDKSTGAVYNQVSFEVALNTSAPVVPSHPLSSPSATFNNTTKVKNDTLHEVPETQELGPEANLHEANLHLSSLFVLDKKSYFSSELISLRLRQDLCQEECQALLPSLRLYYSRGDASELYAGSLGAVQFTPRGTGVQELLFTDRYGNVLASYEIFVFADGKLKDKAIQGNVLSARGSKAYLPEQISSSLKIKDSDGDEEPAIAHISLDDGSATDLAIFANASSGKNFKIVLSPLGNYVSSVELREVKKLNGRSIELKMEEVALEKTHVPRKKSVKSFALDPTLIDFSNGTVTSVASGTELWKCKDWIFATQTCIGTWTKIMDLVPGEEYSFTIDGQDPGFTETSPSTGTPDAGNIVNTGNINYNDGTFASTQIDDNVYWAAGVNNPGGTSNSPTGYLNVTYNLTLLNLTRLAQIVNMTLNLSFCHSNDINAPTTCNNFQSGTTYNPSDVEIYNFTGARYQSVGILTLREGAEGIDSFNINSGFSDFVSSRNLTNFRFWINFTIGTNGRDAVLAVDYAALTIDFDTIKPVISYVYPSDMSGGVARNYIQFNITNNDTNPVNMTAYLHNSSGALLSQNFTTSSNLFFNFTGLADGTYLFNVTAYDIVGNNASPIETRNVTVDTIAPVIQFENNTEQSGTYLFRSYLQVNVSAIDTNIRNLTVFIYGPDGFLINQSSTSSRTNLFVNLSLLSYGTYSFYATACDSATCTSTETRIYTMVSTAMIDPMYAGTRKAMLAYGEGVTQTPQYRMWNGTAFESELSANSVGGTIEWLRLKASPRIDQYALIAADTGDDINMQIYGNLSGIMCWSNGTSCGDVIEFETVSAITDYLKADVAYEQLTGRIMTVYVDTSSTPDVARYRMWDGTSWTAETTVPQTRLAGNIEQVRLAERSNSSEIALVLTDVNDDATIIIWNGTAWGCEPPGVITNTLSVFAEQTVDVGYEQKSGDLLAIFTHSALTQINYTTKPAGSCVYTSTGTSTVGLQAESLNLQSQYASNYILITAHDDGVNQMQSIVWNGTAMLAASSVEGSLFPEVLPNILESVGWAGSRIGVVSYSDAINTTSLSYMTYNKTSNTWVGGASGLHTDGIGGITNFSDAERVMQSYSYIDENRSMLIVKDASALLYAKYFDADLDLWQDADSGVALEATAASGAFPSFDMAWRKYPNSPLVYFVEPTDNVSIYVSRPYVLVNVTASDVNFFNLSILLYNSSGLARSNSTLSNNLFVNLSGLPDGSYYFNATACDILGNCNIIQRTSITVDTTYPVVSLSQPTETGGSYLTRNYIRVNGSISDANFRNITVYIYNVSGLVNSSFANANSVMLNHSGLGEGTYFLNATGCDFAGNCNYSATISVSIDLNTPTIAYQSSTETSGEYLARNYIRVNVSASDLFFANLSIYVYNASLALVNFSTTTSAQLFINLTSLPEGLYYFNATACDLAAQCISVLTRNITTDTVYPVVSFVSPTDASGLYVTRQYLQINGSISDVNYKNITLYIYNSTGSLVNSSSSNTTYLFMNQSALEQGTYWFNATGCDFAGQCNYSQTRNFSVDLNTPLVSYSSPTETDGSFITRNYILVNASASDLYFYNLSISVYNSSLQLVNYSYVTSNVLFVNVSNLNNGLYFFNATSCDLSGRCNSAATRNVTIDTIYPVVSLVPPTENDGMHVVRQYVQINASIVDVNYKNVTINVYNSSGFRVNTSFANASSVFLNHSGLIEGTYWFNASGCDFAGQCNYSETRNFSVDLNDPVVNYVNPTENGGAYVSRSYVMVNVSATDLYFYNLSISIYNSSLSIVNYSYVTSNLLFTNATTLPDGFYLFNATACDLAGRCGSAATRNVTLDTILPLVTFSSPTEISNTYILRQYLQANASIFDANYKNITIDLYNSSGSKINSSSDNKTSIFLNHSGLADGMYFFNATGCDFAGQCNYSENRFVSIDNNVPSIAYEAPTEADGSYVNRSSIIINVSASDVFFSNLSVYIYNSSFQLINSSFATTNRIFSNLTSLPNGIYFFNATACDLSGQCSSLATRNVTVDTGRPSVYFAPPTDNSSTFLIRNYIQINVSAIDLALKNITIHVFNGSNILINVTNATSSPLFLNLTSLVDGTYYFNATACDLAFNCNFTEKRNVTLDNVYPVVSLVAPSENSGVYAVRQYLQVNASIVDVNYKNVTINLYNSSGHLINSSYANASYVMLNHSGLGEGTYFFNATGCDFADQCNYSQTRNFSVDLNDPVVNYVVPSEISGSYVTRSYVLVNISASDFFFYNLSVSIFNSSLTRVNYSYAINNLLFVNATSLLDGLYYFNATACDLAGRCGFAATRNVTLDTILPLVTFSVPTEVSGTYLLRSYLQANASIFDANYKNISVDVYNSSGFRVNTSFANASSVFLNHSGLIEGTYWFNASGCDFAGQCNYSETRNFSVDLNDPVVNYVNPTDSSGSYLARDHILINVSATDLHFSNLSISVYNSSLQLVNYSYVTSNTLFVNASGLTDGMYFFNATACDLAGRCGYALTRNVTIDTITPEVFFTVPTDNSSSQVNRSYILINVSTLETNLANVTINVFNSTGLFNSSVSLVAITFWNASLGINEGVFYFNATACDAVGNCNSTETRNITVDLSDPSVSFVSPTYNSNIYLPVSYVQVNVTASDFNYANITIFIYNASQIIYQNFTTNSTLFVNATGLPDGIYYFNATACDAVGKCNSTLTRNVSLDTINPSIYFVEPTENSSEVLTVSYIYVNVSVSDINFANMTLRLYNSTGLYNQTSSNLNNIDVNFTNLPDEIYFFNATAYDLAGNTNYTETRNVTISAVGPLITLIYPASGTFISTGSVSFNYSVVDYAAAIQSCSLYLDGVINDTNASIVEAQSISFGERPIADGYHNWSIYCINQYSLVTNSSLNHFYVDTAPPIVTLLAPIDDELINPGDINFSYMLNASASDQTNITVYYEYRYNTTTSWQPICSSVSQTEFNCTWSLGSLAFGINYQVRAYGIDLAGNQGSFSIASNITMNNSQLVNITFIYADDNVDVPINEIDLIAGDFKTMFCNISASDPVDYNLLSANATLYDGKINFTSLTDNRSTYTDPNCTRTYGAGTDAQFLCSFNVSYYSPNGTWYCRGYVKNAYTSNFMEDNFTINQLFALNISSEVIDYQNVPTAQTSSDVAVNITNLGNVPINISVYGFGGENESAGANLSMICEINNINISFQKFSTTVAPYDSKSTLASTPVETGLTIQPKANSTDYTYNTTYWQLAVPPSSLTFGQCNGSVVFMATAS